MEDYDEQDRPIKDPDDEFFKYALGIFFVIAGLLLWYAKS